MKRLIAFLVLLLLSTILAAAEESCLVSVTLTSTDGLAAAGAKLAVSPLWDSSSSREGLRLAAADSSGRAELRLERGVYHWVILSPAHLTTKPALLDLDTACANNDLGRIVLASGETLSGRVVDEAGEPLSGATVRVNSDPGRPAAFDLTEGFRILPHREVVTNQGGWFFLPGLAPGVDYRVFVSHPGFRFARQTLTAGAPEVRLQLQPAAGLVVEALDTSGAPVAGARVELERLGAAQSVGGVYQQQTTDAAGRFEAVSREPGETAIVVVATGYNPERRVVTLEPGERQTERFVLAVLPSAPVEVVVVDQEGQPVPAASIALRSVPAVESGTFLHARADPGGRVRWARIPLGDYSLSVQAPEGVASERQPDARLTVGEGGVVQEVVFERPPGRAVSGRVLGPRGEGKPGVRVRVFAGSSLSARTDTAGGFRFPHLPFGKHEIYLEVPGMEGLPAETRRVGSAAEPWTFYVPEAVPIVGRLLLSPGVEVDEAWSVSAQRGEDGMPVSGWVAADLSFRFPALVAGKWTLTAINGRAVGSAEVKVDGEQPVVRSDIAVEVPTPGSPVSGTFLYRGSPLSGARVILNATGPWHAGAAWQNFAADTDVTGSFSLQDVPAGQYNLSVVWAGAVVLRRTVSVETALDLSRELLFAQLRGRVVSPGTDPSALTVRLQPLGPVDDSEQWFLTTHSYFERVKPRADGSFEAGPLEEGRWQFQIDVAGHAPVEREVVIAGEDIEDFVLSLEPTPGLSFRVVTAGGALPNDISATFLTDGQRQPIRGFFESGAANFHWDTLPAGRGTLEVKSRYARSNAIAVTIPGPEVEFVLPARGAIEVHAPLLTRSAGQRAKLVVRAVPENGQLPLVLGAGQGFPRFETLPPGLYEIRVDAADGRSWSATAAVADHETSKIVLGAE